MGIFGNKFVKKEKEIKVVKPSECVRNEEGKILYYRFNIKNPDKTTFSGKISRDEMDIIYRLYTEGGANLTLRCVTREFPQFTVGDMRRILRAFDITKASIPMSPHMREEKDFNDQQEYLLRLKETTLLKRVDAMRISNAEARVKELLIENDLLKQDLNSGKSILEGVDLNNLPTYATTTSEHTGKKDLVVYISDMHIGAEVNHEGVYDNEYNRAEVERRLNKIYNYITSQKDLTSITVFNLGDAIDGMDHSTTRGEHGTDLPQNMSNREMVRTYVEVMTDFFNAISTIGVPLKFISVCESNHGGSLEYAATLCLESILKAKGVDTYVSTRSIEHISVNDVTYVFLHGKDDRNQGKPFPSKLNDSTKAYFQDYLLSYGITGKVIILKGDSHVSSTIKTQHFDYKSVGSLFGASNWIHANFGNNPWGCDYSLFTDGYREDGIISD